MPAAPAAETSPRVSQPAPSAGVSVAATTSAPATEPGPFELGADFGFIAPLTGGPLPFRIGAVGVRDISMLSPKVAFAFGGELGLAFSGTHITGVGVGGPLTASTTSIAIEIVGTARLHGNFTPAVGWYADLGLGLVPIVSSGSVSIASQNTTNAWTTWSGIFQIAAGADFLLAPKVRAFIEPIAIHAYFGASGAAGWAMLAGARWAL